jgi:hypothetical protein
MKELDFVKREDRVGFGVVRVKEMVVVFAIFVSSRSC